MENTVVRESIEKTEKQSKEIEKQLQAIFQQTSQALNNQVVIGKQIQIIQQQLHALLVHNGLVTQAVSEQS
ncbi:MAG: hypothetical protein JSS53_05400 [Proteobacteria bacterium]|nr:hypothetical protein [Pseudomonadota bacterium]